MRAPSIVLLVSLFIIHEALAYDVPTHQRLGLRAAEVADGMHEVLVRDLDLPQGRLSFLQNGVSRLRIADWIRNGAGEEDRPFSRVRHHFHNPLLPWASAGLTLDLINPAATLGMSSVLRGQQSFQEGPQGGGTWTWPFARQRFLAALTGGTPVARELAFADTFRALGHVTHFVQDATVPAHTRNDMHLWLPLGNDRFLPVNPDWYEDWVQDTLDHDRQTFDGIVGHPPIRPLRLVFHSEHPEAPIAAPVVAAGGGSAAAAAAPAAYIERDPSVNKSLLLRLIAGVRGL